jgi:anti-anti-sigma factor
VTAGFDDPPLAAVPARGLAGRRYTTGGCTVLVLSGEIDEASAPELRFALAVAIENRGSTRVVVDLAGVTFMDCAGVGELVRALRRTGWAHGSISLAGPSAFVRRVLELTQAGTVLPVYATVDDAVGEAG